MRERCEACFQIVPATVAARAAELLDMAYPDWTPSNHLLHRIEEISGEEVRPDTLRAWLAREMRFGRVEAKRLPNTNGRKAYRLA